MAIEEWNYEKNIEEIYSHFWTRPIVELKLWFPFRFYHFIKATWHIYYKIASPSNLWKFGTLYSRLFGVLSGLSAGRWYADQFSLHRFSRLLYLTRPLLYSIKRLASFLTNSMPTESIE